MRFFIPLVQERGHASPAHPNDLQDVFGEEHADWNQGGDVAEDAEGAAEGGWEVGVAGAEVRQEGGTGLFWDCGWAWTCMSCIGSFLG